MKLVQLLGCLLIGCLFMLLGSSDPIPKACSVYNFTVMENFDPYEFAGTWFEYSWVRFFFFPEDRPSAMDFMKNYTIINSTHAKASVAGRRDIADDCFHAGLIFDITCNPARWKLSIVVNGQVFQENYWIIDTDYTTYAFVYGCGVVRDDGTCQHPQAWKFVRDHSNVPQSALEKLSEAAQSVCLEDEEFAQHPRYQDCPLVDAPFDPPEDICD